MPEKISKEEMEKRRLYPITKPIPSNDRLLDDLHLSLKQDRIPHCLVDYKNGLWTIARVFMPLDGLGRPDHTRYWVEGRSSNVGQL